MTIASQAGRPGMWVLVECGPMPWPIQTGGEIVRRLFVDMLRKRGVRADITGDLSKDELESIKAHPRSVCIYAVPWLPRLLEGNYLGGRAYVLWALADFPRIVGGRPDADGAQLVLRYVPATEPDADGQMLTVLNPMVELFFNHRRPRSGSAIFAKPTPPWNQRATKDWRGVQYGNLPIEDMAKAFNRHDTLYCYDQLCFFSLQAAMCGCLSVVHQLDGVTPEKWRAGRPMFKYGVAYGYGDVQHALDTRHLVHDYMLELEREGHRQVDALIPQLEALVP